MILSVILVAGCHVNSNLVEITYLTGCNLGVNSKSLETRRDACFECFVDKSVYLLADISLFIVYKCRSVSLNLFHASEL